MPDVGFDGNKTKDELSVSAFTLEVDRRPVLAFASKTHAAADVIIDDKQLRNQLRILKASGIPLCDDYGILRLRLARPAEREIYHDRRFGRLLHIGLLFAPLVELEDRDESLVQAID